MKIEHKGYKAIVEFDSVDNKYYGRIVNIEDAILIEGKTIEDAQKDLEKSIIEYKRVCKEIPKNPDIPK
jgi:predicted HicB family RNase H-like nuclease